MVKFEKIITGFAIAAMCIILPANIAKAGTVSATGDKDTAAVGDSYTVSVTVDGAEGAAVAPDVSVNYDVNRLEFVSCSGEYGGGGGGFITLNTSSADITFTILSGGQADVDVSAIFEDSPEPQIVTATIMVEGEDTAAVDDRAREDMGTGVEAGSIETSDGKLVSAVFADEFMPVGFYKTTVTYEEQLVEAAQFDMGGIVLLYVTDMDGNNGNFDMYDQSTGELSDFLQISGIENRFIIALKAGEDVTVPADFAKATLQWNAQTLEAYAYTGTLPEGSAVNVNDFFLIYAISSEGNKGWYMYDQNEGTYQRYVEGLHGSTSAGSGESLISQITSPVSSDEEGGINVMFIIVIACAVLLLALIITVIIMAVKLHEYNSYDYIDEDEDLVGGNSYLERLAAGSNRNEEGSHIAQEVRKSDEVEEIEDLETDNLEVEDLETKEDKPAKPEMSEKPERAKAILEEKTAPKSENIYEKYRREEAEANQAKPNEEAGRTDIPEEFVVRRKSAKVTAEELEEQNMYERDYEDGDSIEEDDSGMFSPRERVRGYEDDSERLTRADRKALKAEEKARKKAEKRMKKEYGEYGPVDWDLWQSGVEGGAKTAAAHMSRGAGVDEQAVRRRPEAVNAEAPVKRRPEPVHEEIPVKRRPEPVQEETPVRRRPQPEYEEVQPPKDNPMEMMRGIPANDNKVPVQAKPVQQFDLDDDFEFEFLDLDDDDE